MNKRELGMFILRVVVGIVFIAHGWQKIGNIEGVIGFFDSLGFAPFLAYVVAYAEFLGGIAILLGLYTRIAGYLLAVVMLVAIFKVKLSGGLLGGYELDLVLLASLLAISWNGAGPYSVSGKMCGCGACGMCGQKLV